MGLSNQPQKWKGPYRVIMKLGPLNYRVVVEATGEDVCTVHMCNLKPCFPTAEEIDTQEKQKLLEIFQESLSEDEELLGL